MALFIQAVNGIQAVGQFIGRNIWWINIFLSLLVIYLQRNRSAQSTLMWLMILALLPGTGFLIYLLLGMGWRREHKFRLKAEEDERIDRMSQEQLRQLQDYQMRSDDPRIADYSELAAMVLSVDEGLLFSENEVELYYSGNDLFRAMKEDIDRAERSIEFQFYLVKSDATGRDVMDHLIQAADRGVRIRFLVDGIGGRSLYRRDIRRMKEHGIEVAIFFPSLFRWINLRLNYRNHRKLMVVDDRLSYIGGFNIGNEYVGLKKRFGFWRDTHLRIDGSASVELKTCFLRDWYYASGLNPEEEPPLRIYPKEGGRTVMQMVTSGPDTAFPSIKFAFIKMISLAEREVIIQTPYFIPDNHLFETLVIALQEGVEVHIMIPLKKDHPIVQSAGLSYCDELMKLGAHVYLYNGGFLHAKVVMVDDDLSMVGSANVDERSFSLNFEASTLLYSREVNQRLRQQFEIDKSESILITDEMRENKPLLLKIKEPIARLFSPIL